MIWRRSAMTAKRRSLAQRIDWLFTKATILAAFALGIFLGLIVLGAFFPEWVDQEMGFSSFAQALITLAMGGAILIMAILPLISLPYLLSSLFSDNSLDSKGVVLTSVAVLSSAFALMASIDGDVCTRVAGVGGNCAPYQLAYVFDQFSKGGFADVFDIYDFELSVISTSELDGLGKLYTLNFRMISGIYLAMIVLSLYRRFARKESQP
jgi:uncharacterized membrane protein (DUF485 family)